MVAPTSAQIPATTHAPDPYSNPLPSALPFPPLADTPPARHRSCAASSPSSEDRHHSPHRASVLPPSLRPRCAFCLGEFRLSVRNLRRTSICPLHLWFTLPVLTGAFPAQPEHRRRRPKPSPCPCRRSRVPESLLKVTNLSRPKFILSLFSAWRDCSPECSSAAVEPSRRGQLSSGAFALFLCEREMGSYISYNQFLVFDVHHKPHGLTSLPSCHLSKVHKVQHKPTKKRSLGPLHSLERKTSRGAASGAPDIVRCPGRVTHELATLEFFLESLRYNSPDMSGEPTEQRSPAPNGRLWCTVKAYSAEVRSQSCEVITHRTVQCATGLSGAVRGQGTSTVNRSKPQQSADVAGTRQ
jgi:hypothetical protein